MEDGWSKDAHTSAQGAQLCPLHHGNYKNGHFVGSRSLDNFIAYTNK